jgi:preprotein translocase subunit SecG
MDLLTTLLYIVFVLAAIVLIVVVLLQEGKGGGFGGALGSHGQETFGVGSAGINKFTGFTAALFLGSALSIHFINRLQNSGSVLDTIGTESTAPVVPGTVPAPDGAQTPVPPPE